MEDAAPSASDASGDAAIGEGEYLGLQPPSAGFRLQSRGREIPAKADQEYCEVGQLPGTPDQEYFVQRIEAANGRASHHLLVYVAEAGTAADKKLRSLEDGYQTPCLAANLEFGEGLVNIAGSQTPYVDVQYPEGVGIKLRGGQKVVFDYHYFNYLERPAMARSAIAIHTVPKEKLKSLASGFSFTNMTLDIPPSGRKTFTAECTLKHDMMVSGLSRHTHQQSTDFSVWYKGGAQDGKLVWKSLDWEHDIAHAFPQPILMKAGEGFRFSCAFVNRGTTPLRFGTAAKDEMCILGGAIWSPTEFEAKPESCVITWIDEEGVGHDAADEGGFPKPAADQALACYFDTFGFALVDGCVGCICDSCATILSQCSKDADCKALLDCRNGCKAGEDCDQKCEQTFFDHSSAVGMITSVGACVSSKCDARCAPK